MMMFYVPITYIRPEKNTCVTLKRTYWVLQSVVITPPCFFLFFCFHFTSTKGNTFLFDFLFVTLSDILPNLSVHVHDLKECILLPYLLLRPEFFYFLVLGKFLGKPSVGGGNKNKNKIQKFPESE